MGHIFISYSHKDKDYVHKLQEILQSEGFKVWIDDRIYYSTNWPKVIQEKLDTCEAFLVVMSKNLSESEMVLNEVTRAKEKNKTIFSILLDGENWLIVQSKQYIDVRGGKLPPPKFFEELSEVVKRNHYQRALINFPPNKHKCMSNMKDGPMLYATNERAVYYGAYKIVNLSANEDRKTLKISVQKTSDKSSFWIELWPGVFDGIDAATWAKSRGDLIAQSPEESRPSLSWRIEKGEYTIFFVAKGLYISEYFIPYEKVNYFDISYTVEILN